MVIISMMLTCDANVVVGYDKSRSELPSAPLDMEYNHNNIEQ